MQHLLRLFLFSFLLFCGGCQSQAGNSSESAPASRQKIKAPEFTVNNLNGKEIKLKELKGKVVFLDFWATWCGPCVMSLPYVEKLYEEYKGKNLLVLSISLDQNSDTVKSFMRTHEINNAVAMVGTSRVDERYGVQGIPAYILIDQEGNVAGVWEGFNPMMARLWRKKIDQLLKI